MVKYNNEKEKYLKAQKALKQLEEEEKAINLNYIIQHKIINPDGTIPEEIYCIEDEEIFNKANAETAALNEQSGLWQKILNARDELKEAEKNLIAYGLNIIPDYLKDIKTKLENQVKTNYTNRCKVIDLIMQLDVKTVK